MERHRSPVAHQVSTDGKAVCASFPVCTLVPSRVLSLSQDRICRLLRLMWEHLVDSAAVDQHWHVRLGLQRLQAIPLVRLSLFARSRDHAPRYLSGSGAGKDERLQAP